MLQAIIILAIWYLAAKYIFRRIIYYSMTGQGRKRWICVPYKKWILIPTGKDMPSGEQIYVVARKRLRPFGNKKITIGTRNYEKFLVVAKPWELPYARYKKFNGHKSVEKLAQELLKHNMVVNIKELT